MLQMLGQKLKRIPVIKIGIALTLLTYPRSKSDFPILPGNGPCWTGKPVSDSSLCLFLHIVKGPYSKNMRPSGSPPRCSRLKSLVGCYHWFHVQEEGGSTFRCPWRWKTILLAPSCNYKPTMGSVTETNNPYEYDVKVKDQNMESNLHIQPPPTLWSIGHQSSLIIRKYKHHPLAAHTRISSVITPTSPPQYPISN